ncbi:MAG: MBOAT family protein [Alphaproteobacteria bacterium]|nr:MBOAT family protein [Alphaproteobacteria bacterium]
MLFNSHVFIFVFLPTVIFSYWALSFFKSNTLSILCLLSASLLFYGFWRWEFLIILISSVCFNYLCGIWLIKKRNLKFLFFSIALNISTLFYYKYFNLFKSFTGLGEIFEIILPLGISFFTFTQISYLVDCYKGKISSNKFLDYALFVTYFPHLIAGPVLHHKDMISQFRNSEIIKFNFTNINLGLTIFVIGLFKKVILADSIMPFVEPVFGSDQPHNPLDAWGGALAYTLQLYFDFSGYSDMAIGISRIFNIDLPLNFDSPYKAKNIIDFWKRWHISLSSFLKDYLYIPLGGSKHGNLVKYINIFIVMCVSGIWHGAGLTFFLWGVMHGMFLLLNHGFRHMKERFSFWIPPMIGSSISWVLTLTAVVIGWVFFRAHSVSSAILITKSMLFLHINESLFENTIITSEAWYLIMLLGTISLLLPNTQEFMKLHLYQYREKNLNDEMKNIYQQAA